MGPQRTPPTDEVLEPVRDVRTGAETAILIADRAAALFALRGYAATSIREIAEAANVTKPTLYYHFGSKAGLIRHIVEGTLTSYDERLKSVVDRTDTEQALVDLAHEQLLFAEARPAIVSLFVRLEVQPPPDFGVDLEAHQLAHQALLTQFFQNAIERGVLADQDPVFLAWSFSGSMIMHIMARVRASHYSHPPPLQVAQNIVSLLLDGARNRALDDSARESAVEEP